MFCTLCGDELVDGRCTRHRETVTDAPTVDLGGGNGTVHSTTVGSAAPSRRRWPRLVTALLAMGALIVAGLGASLAEIAVLNSQVADNQANASKALKAVQAQLNAQGAATDGLAGRLGALEAKVNATPDPAAIAKAVSPSVFTIDTTTQEAGTAWVASSNGPRSELVTNFHVVADEWNNGGRGVTLTQQNESFPGTITSVSPGNDLAVVTTDESLPALPRDTATPTVGDAVLVVGSPLGLGGSVSNGIVSALRTIDGSSYIQFSAAISPGNSGSPVVDAAGKVIGVAEAKAVGGGAEGIGFAIPVSEVCSAGLSC